MTLHGVDVYLWSESLPDVPRQIGPLSLELMANPTTKVYPGPVPDIKHLDWPRCRYTSDTEVSSADIDALLASLTSAGFTWTKTQKLYRDNGTPLYSQPY